MKTKMFNVLRDLGYVLAAIALVIIFLTSLMALSYAVSTVVGALLSYLIQMYTDTIFSVEVTHNKVIKSLWPIFAIGIAYLVLNKMNIVDMAKYAADDTKK
jgi:glycerol-3-phosphate acyltransferase PlsY